MVAYTHPVIHNGKRILWHGVWRGKTGREYARSAPAKTVISPRPAPQSEPTAAKPSPQIQPLKAFSILADPDDLTASRMARDFAEILSDKGAAGRAIVGSTSPAGVAKVAKTDMADFAIIALDGAVVSAKTDPDWVKRTPMVARLAPEVIEVVAPRDVRSIGDLAGKSASFGDPDSATATSAKMLFSRLGVSINPTYEPLTEGLAALSNGKRGAVVVLGAQDSHALDDFGGDGQYHLVPIPWSAALSSVYAPARVVSRDRPNLIPANDSVETVAEPMALVALDALSGSQRADSIGRVTQLFYDSYDAFLSDNRDPHWRDVNLAADAPLPNADWPRIAAAQGWLDQRKTSADASLDAFRASAKSAADASGGPKAEDSDRLYDDLTRWRGLMQ
jgi:TRAP-type uncharacterized transport system substrate-binding protein